MIENLDGLLVSNSFMQSFDLAFKLAAILVPDLDQHPYRHRPVLKSSAADHQDVDLEHHAVDISRVRSGLNTTPSAASVKDW